MSQLACAAALAVEDDPRIIRFTPRNRLRGVEPCPDVLTRARLERRNRCCPRCGRVTVEPVECDDGLLDRNGHPIPGTASVSGFFCNACLHEWPARLPQLATGH